MSDGATAEAADESETGQALPSREALIGYAGIVVLWAVTIVGGLALTGAVAARDLVLFQDPGNVGNVGVFAALVVGFTAVMILAFRYGVNRRHLRAVLSILFGLYVGTAFTLITGVGAVASATTLFGGLPASPVPVAVGLAAGLVVLAYPEWYVIDAVAVTLGAVVIPMLGLGFGPLPIVVLLVVWAGYDAYTVYVSGHMEELAEGLGELRLPLLFVVPPSLSYSQVEGLFDVGLDDDDETSESTDEATEDDQGPGVRILGLGDAIIPGMLAVSAGEFLDAPVVVPALDAGLPALGAIAGGFVGMLVLFYLLERVERVHAGLPPLNAGVLSGYLLGAVAAGIPLTTAVGL